MREQGETLLFARVHGTERILTLLNFGDAPQSVKIGQEGGVLLSTALDRGAERVGPAVRLRGNEGLLVRIG